MRRSEAAGWEGGRSNEPGPGCPQPGHGPWHLLVELARNKSKLNDGSGSLAADLSASIKEWKTVLWLTVSKGGGKCISFGLRCTWVQILTPVNAQPPGLSDFSWATISWPAEWEVHGTCLVVLRE